MTHGHVCVKASISAQMWTNSLRCSFFSLRHFPFQVLPQRIPVFHFDLFFVSSTLTPTTCMSFTASIYLLFGLPLGLLPGSSISNILLPMYPLSLLCTCPNHSLICPSHSLNWVTLLILLDVFWPRCFLTS